MINMKLWITLLYIFSQQLNCLAISKGMEITLAFRVCSLIHINSKQLPHLAQIQPQPNNTTEAA